MDTNSRYQLLWSILGTIGGIGLLGNSLSLVALRLEPIKMPVSYWLMAKMIVDFGCLLFLPVVTVSWHFSFTNTADDKYHEMFEISQIVQSLIFSITMLILLAATIDRYIAIAKPQISRSLLSKGKFIAGIVAIIIVAMALHIPEFLDLDHHDEELEMTGTMPNISLSMTSDNVSVTPDAVLRTDNIQALGLKEHPPVYALIRCIIAQMIPLFILVIFSLILMHVYVTSKRQLAKKRYTHKKYIANVASTSVVLTLQILFLPCAMFWIAHEILYLLYNVHRDTQEHLYITKMFSTCIYSSANFFIFLAIDKHVRKTTGDLLTCKCINKT